MQGRIVAATILALFLASVCSDSESKFPTTKADQGIVIDGLAKPGD